MPSKAGRNGQMGNYILVSRGSITQVPVRHRTAAGIMPDIIEWK